MASYIKKDIVQKMIAVFLKSPELRDDRWGAMKIVIEQVQKENPTFDLWVLIRLAFDVDRSFRYVQQHIPTLRGEKWTERQVMSGEMTAEEEDEYKEQVIYMRQIDYETQLRLFED
jgi:hypothetical protein